MDVFSVRNSIKFGLPSPKLLRIPSQPYKHDPSLHSPPLNDKPRSLLHPLNIDPGLFRTSYQLETVITFVAVYVTVVLFMNSVNASRNYRPWAFSKTSAFKGFVVAHNFLLALFSAWSLAAILYLLSNYWPSKANEHQDNYYAHIAEYFCRTEASAYQGELPAPIQLWSHSFRKANGCEFPQS